MSSELFVRLTPGLASRLAHRFHTIPFTLSPGQYQEGSSSISSRLYPRPLICYLCLADARLTIYMSHLFKISLYNYWLFAYVQCIGTV